MTDETQKRRITADDLYRFQLVAEPRISPDGEHVIFAVRRVERESEKKYSNLWLVPTAGGAPRQFTYGDQTDSRPHWSPDGSRIAFLSNRKEEKQPQLYVIPFGGGEARPLTDLKGNFGEFQWSPDGSAIVCQFRKKDPEAVAREEDEQKKKLGVIERHITRADFRLNGVGYLPDERWHIWTIDVESGESAQLTEGEYDELLPRWSPDGSEILFISNRSKDPDLQPYDEDLFLIPAGGGEARKIETPVGYKMAPSFSPGGDYIAYVSAEGRGSWWRNSSLWVVAADGSVAPRNLTGIHDLHVSNITAGDITERSLSPPLWSSAGDRLYVQISRHGNTSVKTVNLEGEVTDALSPDGVVGDFSLDHTGNTLAYVWSHFTSPGQIWICELDRGAERQLTHFNEEWLAQVDLGEIEEVWYEGPERNSLQGWILKPPGFDESKQYPSILEIHGGPWVQYGNRFMHEFYFLAAHNYVVYFTNPRGGQGYGEEHSKAIHLDWGGVDYADIMAWTDYVQQLPYIDPERMGITGGSYGGYMTTWIIGHTDRFRAAVAQRMVSNALSFWGSSDVGYLFASPWADEQHPWENFEAYWRQSPMKYIGNVTTPTLIIHSEQDLRANLEQGTQVFLALKQLGVDTELIIFPEESHGLSRGGRTDRRIARLNHILRWFEEYLSRE